MIHIFDPQISEELNSKNQSDRVVEEKTKPTVSAVGFGEKPSDSAKSEDKSLDSFILLEMPNLYKQNGIFMSRNQQFIKYIPSEKSAWLRANHTSLYLLLTLAVERARWQEGESLDGLLPGDSILGSYEEAGITRQQYRDAIEKGEILGIWEVVFNQKQIKQQKRTIKRTIKSIVVNIKDSGIWDLNINYENQEKNHLRTNREPTENHKQDLLDLLDSKDDMSCIPDQEVGKIENPPNVNKNIEEVKSCKKIHPDKYEFEILFDDIIRKAVYEKSSWTTEEIKEAWKRLINYNGYVREPWGWIKGTLKNIKNEKTKKYLNKETKCSPTETFQPQTKNISPNSKQSMLANDLEGRPSIGSLLAKAERLKK